MKTQKYPVPTELFLLPDNASSRARGGGAGGEQTPAGQTPPHPGQFSSSWPTRPSAAAPRSASCLFCLRQGDGTDARCAFVPPTTLVLLYLLFTRFLFLALPRRAEIPELLQGTGALPRTPPQASSERKVLNSHPENNKGH